MIRRKTWSRDSYIKINPDGTLEYWDNESFTWTKHVIKLPDLLATDWQEVK